MSGVWESGKPPTSPDLGGLRFIGTYGGVPVIIDDQHEGPAHLRRRVEIEPYFIQHESWGSAPRPRYKLEIQLTEDHPFMKPPTIFSIPGPWYETPKHTCPLTEAKPDVIMMYSCPVCSGVNC